MGKHAKIQNVDVVTLAKQVGTPLIVYDQGKLEQQLADYHTLFQSDAFTCEVLYASKAFQCDALLQLVKQAGCCLDVVSGGELDAALASNFPVEKIYFHGNNKTREELQMALTQHIGTIVVDNMMECKELCALASEMKTGCNVMFRLNPGIEAHTHEYIVTAHIDSKFGVSIQEIDTISEMITMIQEHAYLSFYGFHAHIGSQIFDEQAYIAEIETLMNFMKKIEQRLSIQIPALNLGGGFAVTYTEEDAPIPLPRVCEVILDACKKGKERYGLSLTHILIEPGRSIVAEAGRTLYRVGYQKQTPHRKYVFVDGGMSDNIRPALYQAKYSCDIANRMEEEKKHLVTVAGKCCESGDILAEDVLLPDCEQGDILMIYTTGAYGYSMASNYNRAPRPAVVFLKDGKARLVIQRERYEDLRALECDEELPI